MLLMADVVNLAQEVPHGRSGETRGWVGTVVCTVEEAETFARQQGSLLWIFKKQTDQRNEEEEEEMGA